MPIAFTRTRAALGADRFGPSLTVLAVAGLLVCAWGAWFVLARVSLYEVSDAARIEADREAHLLQAPIDGRLVSSSLTLGRHVEAGEELARVESGGQQFARTEQQARLDTLTSQIEALRQEASLTERTGRDEQQATRAAIDVARSQVREAEAPAAQAEQDVARQDKLKADGLVTESDLSRTRAEAARRRAAVQSAELTITRMQREQDARDRDRETRLQRLAGEVRRLESDRTAAQAALARLDYEVDRRIIRAPVSGDLGDVAPVKPGAFLKERDTLASIIPTGGLRIVSEFQPGAALGRVRAGQPARLRLQGFPWAQYGSITARVERVATEVREGTVRVELRLDSAAGATSPIPLQHGLPGSVEIEVERVSPARLALRLAGRMLTAPRGGRPVS